MPTYKLTYFNGRGRAEVARQLFAMKGVKYEDIRIEFGDPWTQFKPETPFGQLPILEIDGRTVICQSLAIERYLAAKFGFYGKNELEKVRADMVIGCAEDALRIMMDTAEGSDEDKAAKKKKCEEEQLPEMLERLDKMIGPKGLFLNNKIMWPDISVAHLLSFIDVYGLTTDYSELTPLAALKDRVEAHPKIAAWIQARPETGF